MTRRGGVLRHVAEVAQGDDLPLPLRQRGDGLAQGYALEYPLGLVLAEGLLEGEAVLARLALEALRRRGGSLRHGYVLRGEARLGGELAQIGLPAQALLERSDAPRV